MDSQRFLGMITVKLTAIAVRCLDNGFFVCLSLSFGGGFFIEHIIIMQRLTLWLK